MFQKMGPAPSPRSGHAMASMGSRVFVLGGLGGESLNPQKPDDPSIIHVLDTSMFPFTQYEWPSVDCHATEHIKYPDSSKPPPTSVNGRKSVSAQPKPVQRPSGDAGAPVQPREGSPAHDPASDNDDARRATSPAGRQALTNEVNMASISTKSKARVRDGEYDGESSPESTEPRESAASPDGGRARSPTNAARAISPAQVADVYDPAGPQASLASVMLQRNVPSARSPSPVVERSKSPLEALYRVPSSPTANGFVKPASTGNLTADLIRDLKDKEAEVEAMKKKEAWMKAALLKAERSGFIYAESEEELSSRADDDDIDGRKVTEMVINFKQLKSKIQVRLRYASRL